MKVLILGGDGMLAYALKQVFCFEKLLTFGHKTCDITNPVQINYHLGNLKPDVVINCAAYTDVEMAEMEPNSCELVNHIAVKSLAEACKKHNCTLVHFSTEMVFGQEAPEGYEETVVPLDAPNVYGRTKRLGEKAIGAEWEKHYIVRTSWMFGPHGDNFIDKMLRLGRKDRTLDVVNDQWACPTYTFDLARAVYDLLRDGAEYGVYHLTNLGSTSRHGWAWEIFDYVGYDVDLQPVPSKKFITLARRPNNGVLLNTKRPELRPWVDALVEYLMGIGEIMKYR
jgi:dTDP-4-dehydrorhamnose reductase